jgi:hypothetical protein
MKSLNLLEAGALVSLLALFVAGCAEAPEPTDSGFVSERGHPFATSLGGEAVHEEVTADALAFLKLEILTQIQAFNVLADVEHFFDSAYHADDCNFSGATQAMRNEQALMVELLNPADDSLESTVLALRSFGFSLHAAQDIYAHTNWVELGASGLFETSLAPWPTAEPYSVLEPSGVVIVEGQPPAGTALWRQRGAPYPRSAIVQVQTRAERRLGLISGTVPYEPGDSCPPQIAMTHEELNKDRGTDADRVAQHLQAKALAVQQTAHEWCRVLTLMRERWGDDGDQRLFSWVEDEIQASRCGDPVDGAVDITSVSPNPVDVGQHVQIVVAYSNAGPASAFGTRVMLELTPGLVAQSALADVGSCAIGAAGDIDCYLGEVMASGSGDIQIDALAATSGEQQITAAISLHAVDANAENDSDAAGVTVNAVATVE